MAQYRNTLADLLTWALGDANAASAVMTGIAPALAQVPDDQREKVPQDPQGAYRRMDQTLQQSDVAAFYGVGTAVAAALTTPARIGKVVGACATDNNTANDAQCLSQFIGNFGARAFRRPLAADELALYTSLYGPSATADPQLYADLIATMLEAPQFVYFVEHGDAAVPGQAGLYRLSAFELASRLSYQFWDTMPDAELWQKAMDGSLSQPDVYAREVDRVVDSPRTRPVVAAFFADWLKTDDLAALDANRSDPVYQAFAGGDLPKPQLRQQMIDEVIAMTGYFTWTKPSAVDALLTSDLSFATGADLSKLYGLAPWDGSSAPPAFPPGQRPGVLTRALFLATGTANTRPIMKGAFIRKSVLCNDVPPPPAAAANAHVDLRPDMTTRQVVEALTEQDGSICAGCHKVLINPLGFATEGFDSLGRFRTAQRLFDAKGKEVASKPVETQSIPRVTSDDTTVSAGAADLMRMVVASGQVNLCIARQYFRFTNARWDDLKLDGCVLETLRQRLVAARDLREMFKAIASTPQFQRRAFQ